MENTLKIVPKHPRLRNFQHTDEFRQKLPRANWKVPVETTNEGRQMVIEMETSSRWISFFSFTFKRNEQGVERIFSGQGPNERISRCWFCLPNFIISFSERPPTPPVHETFTGLSNPSYFFCSPKCELLCQICYLTRIFHLGLKCLVSLKWRDERRGEKEEGKHECFSYDNAMIHVRSIDNTNPGKLPYFYISIFCF